MIGKLPIKKRKENTENKPMGNNPKKEIHNKKQSLQRKQNLHEKYCQMYNCSNKKLCEN